MKSAKSVLKGGVNLGAGQVISQICSFVKNVILARLLSTSDYGVAAVFGLALSILEMTSNLATNTLIVQAKEGNDPGFQETAHCIQLTRGLMNSTLLFLIASPVSRLFGIPDAAWGFRCLALVPLIRGLYHLDLERFQRELRFGPSVATGIGANIAGTATALVLGLWLKNYAAMVGVIIIQTVFTTGASQILAQRKYRFSWRRVYARQIFAFGWPLLINGLLMYVIFEGDRIAIGTARQLFGSAGYSMADLGIYSVAFSLTMASATPFISVASSLFLPLLSRVQEKRDKFDRLYNICNGVLYFVAGTIASVFILNGGWIVRIVYGTKYADASAYIGWLACMWALRILRAGPTIAAMAYGDTKNAMISNIARNMSLVGVIAAAATGAPLVWIAISGFLGELVAIIVCVWRLEKVHAISARLSLKPGVIAGAAMLVACLLMAGGIGRYGLMANLLGSMGLLVLLFLGILSISPQCRAELRGLARG